MGKGTVISETAPGLGASLSRATVAVAADEILAFASTPYAHLGAKRSGVQDIFVDASPGASVDWYKFKIQTSSSATAGLQLFDAAGNLLFCATQKPIRISSVIGTGSHSLTAGRTYAFLPAQVYVSEERFWAATNVGTDIDWLAVSAATADCIRRISGGAEVASRVVSSVGSGPYDEQFDGWAGTSNNGMTTSYLVLDVTNF